MFRAGLGCCAVVLSFTGLAADLPPAATVKVDYSRDIEPLLSSRCYMCHGPKQQMSGLRLDRKDAALKVIQTGNSAASRLIHMVAGMEKKVMPPMGARLAAAEIGLLRAWIDQGVSWPALETKTASAAPSHWSFRPIAHPGPPAVRDRAWPRNPIDA